MSVFDNILDVGSVRQPERLFSGICSQDSTDERSRISRIIRALWLSKGSDHDCKASHMKVVKFQN